MKAFITGANGFVGQWLCEHLETCGDEVVLSSEELDITNAAQSYVPPWLLVST